MFRKLSKSIRESKLKSLVFSLILIFYGSLLLHQIKLPASDDLGRHIKNGEMVFKGEWRVFDSNLYSYTEPENFFANHHWLFGAISYVLDETVGFEGMVVLKIIVMLAAFSILFFFAAKKSDFWLAAFFSISTILILMERTSYRPEIFSYLFIAIFIYLLHSLEDNPKSKKVFWLVFVQFLWVNIHIFFVIGMAMVGGFLLEKIILNRKNFLSNPLVRKLSLLLVLLAIASTLNPHGIRGAILSFPLNIKGESPILIAEDVSILNYLKGTSFGSDISVVVFLIVIFPLALSFVLNLKQRPIFFFLASTATATITFMHLRSLALFGLIFLPAISINSAYIFESAKKRLFEKKPEAVSLVGKTLIYILISLLMLLTFFGSQIGIQQHRSFGIGLTKWSNDGAIFFKEQGLKGPIFNDADVGSYLIYHLYPETRVFTDNRFGDAYSPDFFNNDYLPAFLNEDKWQEIETKYRFESIFIYQYDAVTGNREFLSKRMNDPEWAFVYADVYNLIFIRNTVKNQEKIKNFGIKSENAEEKLSHLLKSEEAVDQIAGADIAFLLGREDLAMKTYLDVVARWPEEDSVWMVMAQIELRKNGPDSSRLAALYLEKSLELGRKTAEVYSFLGLAYLRLEQLEKGRKMLEKALEINPERGDARDFIRQLDERLKSQNMKQ